MKQLLCALLSFLISLSLLGCGANASPANTPSEAHNSPVTSEEQTEVYTTTEFHEAESYTKSATLPTTAHSQTDISAPANSYLTLIENYQQIYGSISYTPKSGDAYYTFTGLLLAKTFDFDGDGTKELLLVYNDNPDIENTQVHIWGLQNDVVNLLWDDGGIYFRLGWREPYLTLYSNPGTNNLYLYCCQCSEFDITQDTAFATLNSGAFSIVQRFSSTFIDSGICDYYLDEKRVSEQEYDNAYNSYIQQYRYTFCGFSLDDASEKVSNLQAEIQQTIDALSQ